MTSQLCVCVCVQVYCRDEATAVRQAQELTTNVRDAGAHLVRLGRRIAANSRRYELHGATITDTDPLYLLQRRVSHLLVDDVILHPVCRHRAAVLADIPRHSPSHAASQCRYFRSNYFRWSNGAAQTSGYLRRRQSRECRCNFRCGRLTGNGS